MSGYKTHDRFTLMTAVVLVPLCYWGTAHFRPKLWGSPLTSTPWFTTLLVVGAYLFSGLLLSSDLDIYSRIYQRWGPLRWLWYPYQRLIAHRSWLSHNMIVGPLLRILYLYAMVELGLLVAYRIAVLVGASTSLLDTSLRLSADVLLYLLAHPQVSAPILLGLILGGLAHSLVDLS